MGTIRYIDKQTSVNESMPVGMMVTAFKAASKNGLETMDELDDQGTMLIFDKSLKVSSVESQTKDRPKFSSEGHFMAFIHANEKITVNSIDGLITVASNNIQHVTRLASQNSVIKNSEGTLGVKKDVINWLGKGERGLSSEFMCNTLFGIPKQQEGSYRDPSEYAFPYDPDDLSRCIKFLNEIPEARERLNEIAQTGEEWSNLIQHWDELEVKFNNDDDDLYELMKELTTTNRSPR